MNVLDALPSMWWPSESGGGGGESNYTVRATCGSSFTVRLAVPCIHLGASCCKYQSEIAKPHTYGLRKPIQSGDDLDMLIMTAVSKLFTCGRKVWCPKSAA